MENRKRSGYKTLLTSLTIATILSNMSIQEVHAGEEELSSELKSELEVTEDIAQDVVEDFEQDVEEDIDQEVAEDIDQEVEEDIDRDVAADLEHVVAEEQVQVAAAGSESNQERLKEAETQKNLTQELDTTSNNETLKFTSGDLSENLSHQDYEGPEILDVTVDKEIYKRGEVIEATVVAFDESQIERISLTFERDDGRWSPHTEYVEITDFTLNEDGNYVGTGTFQISTYDYDDKYQLVGAWGNDVYGNSSNIGDPSVLESVSFTITDKPEVTAPELISVELDKSVYQPGETIQATVVAYDDSGVESVNLNFNGIPLEESNAYRNISFYIDEFSLDESGNYVGVGHAQVPDYILDSDFNLEDINVYDIHGNYQYYSPYNESDFKFEESFEVVGSEIVDYIGPEILDVMVDKEIYKRGEVIEATVVAFDESQIERISLTFERDDGRWSPHTEYVEITDFTLNEDGNYVGTGTFQIFTYDYDDKYQLVGAWGNDVYGNSSNIGDPSVLESVSFTITDKPEVTAPELISVELDKSVYQ
ncbi:hypothetical protein, partial [Aerococcus viridans]|uniref:hypothetical protein n=1 Tax=Aerococcus viridans TaxID=1377 RepID=UPI003B20CD2D